MEKKSRKPRAPKIQIQDLIPNTDQSSDILANELYHLGVSVITDTWLKNKVSNYDEEWNDTLYDMPEYKRFPTKFVQGGFQALGNPSSYHNPFVRKIRQWSMSDVIPILSEYKNLNKEWEDYGAEQYVDRMMYRPPGEKPGAIY